jgi:hypothetical protein
VVEEFQDRYGDGHSGSDRFVGGAAEQGGGRSPPSCGPGFASCPTRTQATGWPFISGELAQVAPPAPVRLGCVWMGRLFAMCPRIVVHAKAAQPSYF